MSNNKDLEQIKIKLEPELRERMITLIDAGYYSSYNEMIRDALRHLMEPYKEEIKEGMKLKYGDTLAELLKKA